MVEEEPVLDQKIENEVDETLHCHECNVFPHKLPSERIYCVVLTWKQRRAGSVI